MNKYEITNEAHPDNSKLHRIRALPDELTINGVVYVKKGAVE